MQEKHGGKLIDGKRAMAHILKEKNLFSFNLCHESRSESGQGKWVGEVDKM